RAEEILIGDAKASAGHLLTRSGLRATFNFKGGLRTESEEWRMVNDAHRFDTGQGLHTFDGLGEEVDNLRALIVAGVRQRDAHRQRVPRVEASVHASQPQETEREHTGAEEQSERERDFGDDQGASQSPAARAAGQTPARFLERVIELNVRRFEGRDQAENDAGQQSHYKGEAEHGRADLYVLK